MTKDNNKIGIVGLGYVGLPLFSLFSQKYECWGIDNDALRTKMLQTGIDRRKCLEEQELIYALQYSHITNDWNDLTCCNIFIVAVPTPVDKEKRPDFTHLEEACKAVGNILSRNNIVIFESTVYPGTTDEICIPILEKTSGLVVNKDFSVAYSPERINVGDKIHRLDNVPKIVSASNQQTLEFVADLYGSVINAEVVRASNIKVAEAAKMYENVQRDVLIALANQYSDYCHEEGIDILEVTDCAATKWNFSNVKPGLVGGHCIGVDAYYLLQRSFEKGCSQSLVNTARSINEDKVCQVTDRIVKLASSINKEVCIQKVLILGFSYKPNTCDIRNTKIADLLINLKQTFGSVDCYDPLVDYIMVEKEYSIKLIDSDSLDINQYDITILAVNHDCFKDFNSKGLINITDLL